MDTTRYGLRPRKHGEATTASAANPSPVSQLPPTTCPQHTMATTSLENQRSFGTKRGAVFDLAVRIKKRQRTDAPSPENEEPRGFKRGRVFDLPERPKKRQRADAQSPENEYSRSLEDIIPVNTTPPSDEDDREAIKKRLLSPGSDVIKRRGSG